MARIRTLKPDHRLHRKIGPLSDRQYRLWVGLLCEADDEGRLIADANQLRLLIFGYHPEVSVHEVAEAMTTLEGVGLIRLYRVGETLYAEFPSWFDHQYLTKPYRSTLPPSPQARGIPKPFRERSRNVPVGTEQNRKKQIRTEGFSKGRGIHVSSNGSKPERARVRAGIAGRSRMSEDAIEAEIDRRIRKRART